MKLKNSILFIFISLFFFNSAQADFLDATEAYDNKDYSTAFKEFSKLAKLGNKRAQFNLGVMYLNGEGVTKNLELAYAWGKLSENEANPEYAQISENIWNQFSETDKQKLTVTADKIKKQFGQEAIAQQYVPVQLVNNKKPSKFKLNIKETKAPRFPIKALKEGKQGWVTVLMDIYPDGSVRNTSVIESFPDDSFDQATIDAVSGFKFNVESEEPLTTPVQARQTIEFQINTDKANSKLKKTYKKRLDKLHTLAENNHPEAQYLYAVAANASLLQADDKLSDEEVNQWLLKSAKNGNIDAQYMLGKNIIYGSGCEPNDQKGIKWLLHAAEYGHDKASRELYQLLKNNKAQSEMPAHHWLKMSADAGNPESQLEYSAFLLSQENPSDSALQEAGVLLKNYEDNRKKSVKWYQQMSRLEHFNGNGNKADKYRKKAEKLAKKLGWDLSVASL